MRHLLINTKPPADWLVAVRTFTSVVDASRTSLYRFSKRRFRSNFGPPGGLPACLPLPDSNLFPPFLCPFKHFRLRVLILLCKSTNESFENNRNRDRNILEDIKTNCNTYSCVEIYEFFILGKKLCIKYAPRRNGGTVIFYDLIDTDDRWFDDFRFTRGACSIAFWFSVIRINKRSIVSPDKDIYRWADIIYRATWNVSYLH